MPGGLFFALIVGMWHGFSIFHGQRLHVRDAIAWLTKLNGKLRGHNEN